jgi:hypothetical protein
MKETSATEAAGSVTGGVRMMLRLEGLALFVGMVLLYAHWGASWWLFALLFLAPDLSFIAYLAGSKIGALVYNAVHSYVAPIALMALGIALIAPMMLSIATIWVAHIGIDRSLGYGLKYSAGFAFTHLGGIGKVATT